MLLSAVYHHVLAQSPSPKAAEIAILAARKNGQLRWRCTLRELKAQPGLQLAPGEELPPAPTVITLDYVIPRDTAFRHSISGFGPDWERSSAHSRDSDTRSLFEYDGIVVNRDEVLARWPPPLPRAPEIGTPPPPEEPGEQGPRQPEATPPRFVLPERKPQHISDLAWAAARALVAIRNEHAAVYSLLNQGQLVDLVNARLRSMLPELAPELAQIEKRTLQTAVAELRRQLPGWPD